MNMQISLKPLQQRCGSSPLLLPLVPNVRLKYQHVPSSRSPSGCASVVTCSRSDSHHQHSFAAPAHAPASIMFAAALALSNAVATDAAFAKTNPPKKSDPYEELQNLIKSRGDSNSSSLFETFQKSAKEAAKVPAEILKASPAQPPAPAPAPSLPVPLPITKALPRPDTKTAAASTSGGGSTGLLAGVGALVVAAGFALTRAGGGKSAAPKPNKIKAKIKGGAKQVGKQANKQASRPTFSLPSLGGKAQQVGKTGKIKAAAASNQAKKAASSGAGFFGTGSTRGKSTPPAKSSGSGLLGTGLTRGKSTPPAKGGESGLFGTGSTRGNSPAPAKGGGLLGTRSTRPSTQSTKPGGTEKVKVTPRKSVTAAKKAVSSGGKSLVDEDTGTTVGALGVVGLAVAVGGLTVSSIIGGGGGGGASAVKAPQPVKQLLDRVPEPLPVGRKLQQTASQVSSKATEAVPQSNPSLGPPSPPAISPPSIPNPKDIQPPPVPTPKDTLPPVAQTPQTPSGPDLVPELMQKPKTGAPLAPPPSDAIKPKIPSGPDLRVPGPPSSSLGITPQLANGPSKAAGKISEAVPQLANAPSASKTADKATKKVTEAAPPLAQAAPAAAGPSIGNPAALLGLTGLVVGGVLFAKQTQPQTDSKSRSNGGPSKSSSNGASPSASASTGGQAPQSAEEAAADAKKRAAEAREWINSWKSKQ